MAMDPVCLCEVDEQEARRSGLTYSFEGQTYYFCSKRDKEEFIHHAVKYTPRDAETNASEEGMPPPPESP